MTLVRAFEKAPVLEVVAGDQPAVLEDMHVQRRMVVLIQADDVSAFFPDWHP